VTPQPRSWLLRQARALLLACLALSAAAAPGQADDPSAAAIASRMQETMGGESFATARVLRFAWAVEREGKVVSTREHTWDRWTGNYRIEAIDRNSGEPWLAIFNVDSRQGRVWLGGVELRDEDLADHLERAYGAYINDTYWLLMPWKWLEPGVQLRYIGTERVGEALCDVVELEFEDVGLTSNDRYRGYVDRESGLMVRWGYVLQDEAGDPGDGEPTMWDWTDWREVDPGVWFSQRKTRVGADVPVSITSPVVTLVVDPSADELANWFTR